LEPGRGIHADDVVPVVIGGRWLSLSAGTASGRRGSRVGAGADGAGVVADRGVAGRAGWVRSAHMV